MPANTASLSATPHAPGQPPAHLILPLATSHAPSWQTAMASLPVASTRNLRALLRGMQVTHTDVAESTTLSPPHERVLARALGWGDYADGLLPWAADYAQREGLAGADKAAWCWVTPCHWAMGREHAILSDPAALAVSADESRTLIAELQPYFATDGITLHQLQQPPAHLPGAWLAQGEIFRSLPTASLDRVLGRNVDAWLPGGAAQPVPAPSHRDASTLRRLQNEVQMLLYTHRINDQRAEQGQAPINSVWFSGSGAAHAHHTARSSPDPAKMLRDLTGPVFADDWDAYAQAWATLDAQHLAPLLALQRAGHAVQLSLCGERGAQTWTTHQPSMWAALRDQLIDLHVLPLKPLWDGREQL